jgi:hypothetical protein
MKKNALAALIIILSMSCTKKEEEKVTLTRAEALKIMLGQYNVRQRNDYRILRYEKDYQDNDTSWTTTVDTVFKIYQLNDSIVALSSYFIGFKIPQTLTNVDSLSTGWSNSPEHYTIRYTYYFKEKCLKYYFRRFREQKNYSDSELTFHTIDESMVHEDWKKIE